MKNKEYYQSVFDEVHVPQDVLGKVMDMGMKEKKLKKKKVWKNAMTTVAALAICFVASNGICYAATGSTWTEQVLLYINGEPVQKEVTWHEDADGVYATFELEAEDGDEIVYYEEIEPTQNGGTMDEIEFTDDMFEDLEIDYGNYEIGYDEMMLVVEIVEENGSVYLVINEEKIDITEDFADGSCSGTVELEGSSFTYQLDGTVEEYSIQIQ